MAITFSTAYPANLTNAHWQKSKNKLDKVSKSGLGPLLNKAQADWGKIKWDVLQEKKRKPDPADFLGSLKADHLLAKQELAGPVKTAYDSLKAASVKAHKVSKTLTLSKGAATTAAAMSGDLHQQALLLKGIKLTDFEQAITEMEAAAKAQDGIYKKGVADVEKGLGVLRSDPSFTGWEKAGMLNKTSYVRSQVYSAIQVGRKDFQPRKQPWLTITNMTQAAEKVVKGADASADTKAIVKYVKEVEKLMG